jgi:cytochrome b
MQDTTDRHLLRVWDLPTRAFHWLLAATVVASVVTAKIGGNAMEWHIRLGLFALALLVFRLAWGFVGGHWSRFASFVYAPSQVLGYLRGDAGPQGRYDVGHSPLGALSVFALLALLLVQVATGLVADDEIATTGWHKSVGQYVIITLVVLHIAAIVFYLHKKERNLVAPMWHGDKPLPAGTPFSRDGAAQRLLAAVLMAAALGLSWWISRLGG